MYLPPSEYAFHPGNMAASELARLISRKDPIILEVGANVGQTTEEFLAEMPEARIFCFEPDPRAISLFKEKIASANVTLVERAVGNFNGFAAFHQSSGEGQAKDWNQSGSIRNPKLHLETWPWVKFDSRIHVPIVRLDDWARENKINTIDLYGRMCKEPKAISSLEATRYSKIAAFSIRNME
jgi:FkbM family methyltransferase